MKAMVGMYTPLGLDGYELCHPVNQDDFERISVEVNGTPRQAGWRPMPVRLVHDNVGRDLVKSDSPWLGAHALIFRSSTIASMGAMFRENGELLPLACMEADLWMYNPTRVVNALDEGASSVLRFADGRIMVIQRHVFRADVVRQIDIFKIPNLRVSPTYVSHRFVDQWEVFGLKGLEFKQVWAPSI